MFDVLKTEIRKNLVGKEDAIQGMLIALLSGGHVLIEDLPGLGKTTLAKAFAKALNCNFQRVQFTPDLMPSDLMGVSVFNKEKSQFVFQKGPIFTNVLLADEINRTSPKTQSSLLEAMEEAQLTIDGNTYLLEAPFMVIATENPIELQGTFPLPEAQLDRFMMRLSLGYPTTEEEIAILTLKEKPEAIIPVLDIKGLVEARQAVEKVYVDDALKHYIVRLCQKTRDHTHVKLGASPRAVVHLFNGIRAKAYLDGRDFATAQDVMDLYRIVVAHRVLLKGEAQYRGVQVSQILEGILQEVEVPKVKR
jgi:MoxR-like ATPase